MANYSDIQHRFANKLEGKYGCIKAGNVRYEGRNYFSYGTVFGQWVDISKKMWKIVSRWHEYPKCFKPMEIDTKGSGRYTISSYKNDILTAGCHKIAYTEMERMYNEIQGL